MNGNDFEHKHLIVLRSVTSPSNKFCFLSFFFGTQADIDVEASL